MDWQSLGAQASVNGYQGSADREEISPDWRVPEMNNSMKDRTERAGGPPGVEDQVTRTRDSRGS